MPTLRSVPSCGSSAGSSVNACAFGQQVLPAREALDADLRALQVAEQRDVLADALGRLARMLDAAHVVGRAAVREVDAQHVGARADHFLEHAGASVAGPSVATILVRRVSIALCHVVTSLARLSSAHPAARCSSIATAGSFLPSRNSRKAPPPVEM